MLLEAKYAMADIVTMRAEARRKGGEEVAKLYKHLMSQGRDEEWQKAVEDPEYCDELIKSLNLEND